MHLIVPRFCGQQLVNFAQTIGDILDLVSVTITDKTDGRYAFGAGDVEPALFTFEDQRGAKVEIEAVPGAELNPKLASRYVAAELGKVHHQREQEAPPPPETRRMQSQEALRVLDRLRNEVGGIKASFPTGFDTEHDATVHGEILFNDKSTITILFGNSWPMKPETLQQLIDDCKRLKAERGNRGTGGAPVS